MNIRPRAGETVDLTIGSLPQLRPVSQNPISCPGYARVLGATPGSPRYAHLYPVRGGPGYGWTARSRLSASIACSNVSPRTHPRWSAMA
jgi:hypothetical protein